MKFSTCGIFSILMATAAYAAPVAEANADADADAWRWHQWVRGVGIYKREAAAEAKANADADAWRWHEWVRGVAIYKRENATDIEENQYEQPLGMAYAFASNATDAVPVAYYPLYASDLETQFTELLNKHPSDLQLEKREAEADAEAWRWHEWVRGVAIYKREDAASDPANWEWHVTFTAPEDANIQKRDAEAEANADADADAWRLHEWVRGVAIY